jgi:hypothetical protein
MNDIKRWEDLDKLLTRPTVWANSFIPDTDTEPKVRHSLSSEMFSIFKNFILIFKIEHFKKDFSSRFSVSLERKKYLLIRCLLFHTLEQKIFG